MSMHKIPLTPIEEAGLRAHGLDIGTPSQLSDAFRQGVRYASAQLPNQGGEAVEAVKVVGYLSHCTDGYDPDAPPPPPQEPLMTVAQHQRILAAATNPADQGGEAVATDAFVPGSLADLLFQLGEKGIGVSGGTHGDHWRVSPLYTRPSDQVADDLTMVKVSRELLEQIAVELEHDNDRYFLGRELRALLASAEGAKDENI